MLRYIALAGFGLLAASAVMFLGMPIASAQIFLYTDWEGRTYITDTPMKGERFELVKHYDFGRARKGWTSKLMIQRRSELSPLIARIARENSLQPEFVHAVIRAESAYDADAVSPKGAVGLMQLMPATADRFDVMDRNDPEQNIDGGVRYLRLLLDQFDNDMELALAAYNAGEHRVIQYGYKIPPYTETRNYVRKVMKWYRDSDYSGISEQL